MTKVHFLQNHYISLRPSSPVLKYSTQAVQVNCTLLLKWQQRFHDRQNLFLECAGKFMLSIEICSTRRRRQKRVNERGNRSAVHRTVGTKSRVWRHVTTYTVVDRCSAFHTDVLPSSSDSDRHTQGNTFIRNIIWLRYKPSSWASLPRST